MARYIDADKLLHDLPDDLPYKASVKRVLMQAPTADVVEAKHGEWIMGVDEADYEYGTCSVCGYIEREYFPCGIKPKHCIDCGAKMDGTPKEREAE